MKRNTFFVLTFLYASRGIGGEIGNTESGIDTGSQPACTKEASRIIPPATKRIRNMGLKKILLPASLCKASVNYKKVSPIVVIRIAIYLTFFHIEE